MRSWRGKEFFPINSRKALSCGFATKAPRVPPIGFVGFAAIDQIEHRALQCPRATHHGNGLDAVIGLLMSFTVDAQLTYQCDTSSVRTSA
jgi:hypothetical protein